MAGNHEEIMRALGRLEAKADFILDRLDAHDGHLDELRKSVKELEVSAARISRTSQYVSGGGGLIHDGIAAILHLLKRSKPS